MSISYSWDVEVVATRDATMYGEGDIIDHVAAQSYEDAKRIASQPAGTGFTHEIVLVRDDDIRSTRAWAYVDGEGFLPQFFEDAWQNETWLKVPARFHDEVRK